MSCDYDCLHNNIVVESLVVVLTLISGLAITGENLIVFNLITVPLNTRTVSNGTSSNYTDQGREGVIITENTQTKDVLTKVFHYASLGIAGLFLIEIVVKVCSLQRRCVTNPWQIFDGVVVVTSLVLELVFHCVSLGEKGVYSLTYIVLLRLWRIPMLCNIRAQEVLEANEYDLELYRNGRLKAEDRCRMLEASLLQRHETIQKLEKVLRDLTGTKQTDLATRDGPTKTNGHLNQGTHTANDILKRDPRSPQLCDSQSYNLFLRSAPKQFNPIFQSETETVFMGTSHLQSTATRNKLSTNAWDDLLYTEIAKENTKQQNKLTVANALAHKINHARYSFDHVDGQSTSTCENNNVMYVENSTALASSLVPRKNQIFLRPRKRRSSASEIYDYLNVCSPKADWVFYNSSNNSISSPRFGVHKDVLVNKELHGILCTNNDNPSASHDGISGIHSSETTDGQKNRQTKRRLRRFMSCPEFVFTQRMNITNDESMLIGGQPTDDHFGYNNLGFYSEETFLPVMAEFDGSTTYINEDGIPMTSL